MMQNVNITSVNVRGLNTYEKRNNFFTWVNQSTIDVLLLQETHFVEKIKEKYDTNWNGKSIYAFSDSAYSRDVSILFRKELDVQILNTHKSEDARKVLVNVKLIDEILSFVSIYTTRKLSIFMWIFQLLPGQYHGQEYRTIHSLGIHCGCYTLLTLWYTLIILWYKYQ